MATGAQIVQSILETLNSQNEQANREKELAQNEERIQVEKDYRKAEADRFTKDLALREKQFDAQNQLNQINRQILAQKVAEGYVNNGILPPDSMSTPVGGAPAISGVPALGLSGSPGQAPTHSLVNIPGVGDMLLPTPEYAAQIQANRQRIINQPAIEAEQARIQAQNEATTKRELDVAAVEHANRLAEQAQQQQFETNRQNIEIQAQKAINNTNNARAMQAAVISATGGLFGMPKEYSSVGNGSQVRIQTGADGQPQITPVDNATIIQNWIDKGRAGQVTIDDLKKSLRPQQVQYISNLANQNGVAFLTKDQKAQLDGLNDIAKIVPNLQILALLRANQGSEWLPGKNSTWMPFGTDTKAYQLYKNKEQQFGSQIARIASVLGNIRRLNMTDMEATLKSILPDKSPTADPMNGIDKYNKFVTDLQNDYQSVLSSLPEGQRAIIIKQYGGTSFPYINKAFTNPGQAPGTPAGATPSMPAMGTDKIKVIRKSDMQPGFISPQYFDPNKYIKAPAGQ